MTAFWTSQALSVQASALLSALYVAHGASADRDNLSTHAIQLGAAGSGSYAQALAAGLMTLGAVHGPIVEAGLVIDAPDPAAFAAMILRHGQKVPGWGNSFYKGVPDPLWFEVDRLLWIDFPALASQLSAVTQMLHSAGRPLYPNPAAYTAAAARALGCPLRCAPYLFIAGRLDAWSRSIANILHPQPH